ncbi:MAG: uL29 family ribosomal protein [Candidatus ainarchaeum sp.]|nr:uL29 family ribosomal protein [Candidatus ainarchaeum sp.]
MAVAKTKDLRALPRDELQKRLETYRREMLELGDNPKKGMNLRRAIARILTLMNEKGKVPAKAPAAKKAAEKKVK